jgi:hypothetical protein
VEKLDKATRNESSSTNDTDKEIFSGVGLKTAVAGEPTSILLKFRNEMGHPVPHQSPKPATTHPEPSPRESPSRA